MGFGGKERKRFCKSENKRFLGNPLSSLLKISLVVVGKYLGEKPYFGNWASVPSVCFSHGTSV